MLRIDRITAGEERQARAEQEGCGPGADYDGEWAEAGSRGRRGMATAAAEAEAPALVKRMTTCQQLGLSAFWFANQLHWGALATVMIMSQAARMALAHPGGLTKSEIS